MKWNEVNFLKLGKMLLPEEWRTAKHLDFLLLQLYPLKLLYQDLLYKMQHDSRVIYLEKLLNEWFKVEGYSPQNHDDTKTVLVKDGFRPKKKYIYQKYEYKPTYIYLKSENKPLYIYKGSEFLQQFFNFVVFIPVDYVYNDGQLIALINYYKLAGKQFKIERY